MRRSGLPPWRRLTTALEWGTQGFLALGEQGAKVGVEEAVVRIVLLARVLKSGEVVAVCLAHHGRRQSRSLVQQGHAITVHTELVVGVDELVPPRVGG